MLFAAALLCVCPRAYADDLQPAREALEAGRFEDAAALYSRAFRAAPDASSAEGLAQAEARLGRHRDAAEHFAIALSFLPPTDTEGKTRLQARLLEEKAFVATVIFTLEGGAAATMIVDGVDVGAAPLPRPLYLEPGEHTFAAQGEGVEYVAVKATLEVGKTVTLELRKVPPKQVVVVAPPKELWPGIVLASASGVALAIGIGTLVVSTQREEEAEELATTIDSCDLAALDDRCQQLSSLVTKRNDLRNASTIGFVAAGVLVGATLGYFLIPIDKDPDAPPPRTTWLAPIVSPDAGGFVLGGTF